MLLNEVINELGQTKATMVKHGIQIMLLNLHM